MLRVIFLMVLWGLAHWLKDKQDIARFIKYALVGAIGLFISMGLLWVFVEYLGLLYIVASVIAGEIGMTVNFFGYEVWTFRDVKRSFSFSPLAIRWLKYNMVRLSGMGIGLAILTGLVEGMGVHYFIANLIGTFLAIVFNYILSIVWIWRRRPVK